jgi:hypothetical protein
MPKHAYREIRFQTKTLAVIDQANSIIAEYEGKGYSLTLRQLYYQFVSRGLMENKVQNYDRLGVIVSDARLAGLIDWSAIEDRTRNLQSLMHWTDAADRIRSAARTFRLDRWDGQENRPEVWIEKDALTGVIAGVCESNDVPYIACRGFMSQSEQWAAAQRFLEYIESGQTPHVIHLGDHDPSGIDMSRDIQDRLEMFCGEPIPFTRIALNMDQVQQYNPPPNPAKETDCRFEGYRKKYGSESWELDSLDPQVISDLVGEKIAELRDDDVWAETGERESDMRGELLNASRHWPSVVEYLNRKRGKHGDDNKA